MDFESKIISREISQLLWEMDKTVGTAESCTGVACQMVVGACKALNTDYAISATGYAGPGGGTKEIPVGTIWLACGTQEKQVAMMVQEDHGRDINLAIATNKAIQMFLDFLKSEAQSEMEIEKEG